MKKKKSKLFHIIGTGVVIMVIISTALFSLPEKNDEAEKNSENEITDVLKNMTISDMIYQMMFVTPESITGVGQVTAAGEKTKAALKEYPVGGIIYFSDNLVSREQTIEMIKNTQSFSKIPLFIGVDEEGGRVSRLGKKRNMGVSSHPPMREIGNSNNLKKAYEIGETLATDIKALGFNVNFAPDADVLVNEKNTEIGDRSFGNDPLIVANMVSQVVKGLQENGISAALKHFPGHGSTHKNSHTGYSESERTWEEIDSCEILPFKAGIEAGSDFVMISHMTLVNACKEKVPASLSKEIITDKLITEMGYNGIIITDSFSMGAVTKKFTEEEAVVKAIKAGVDMLLIPTNPKTAHDAIYEATQKGEITKERLKKSAEKILKLKKMKEMLP